jgi:hypothetical protein
MHVSHDRLHDEVIIINVRNGTYYAASGTAADVWTLISQGASVAEAAKRLASAYSANEKLILDEVDECVKMLLRSGLVEPGNGRVRKMTPVLPDGARAAWTKPIFEEHTDMWELIKLDPIHEVDEVGWPIAKTK